MRVFTPAVKREIISRGTAASAAVVGGEAGDGGDGMNSSVVVLRPAPAVG